MHSHEDSSPKIPASDMSGNLCRQTLFLRSQIPSRVSSHRSKHASHRSKPPSSDSKTHGDNIAVKKKTFLTVQNSWQVRLGILDYWDVTNGFLRQEEVHATCDKLWNRLHIIWLYRSLEFLVCNVIQEPGLNQFSSLRLNLMAAMDTEFESFYSCSLYMVH